MLTALLIAGSIGIAASRLKGAASVTLVSALTIATGYASLVQSGTGIAVAAALATLTLVVMQTAYLVGLLLGSRGASSGAPA